MVATTNDALRTWTHPSVFRPGPAAWRAIRSMRHAPPGAAELNPDRAAVFRAALEQAQQQVEAAGTVGYESRPLNLFYGLSQAGRAIAAAAVGLDPHYPAGVTPTANEAQTPWGLKRHGIEADTDKVTEASFPDMTMTAPRPDPGKGRTPSGSFARLAALLSPGCDVSSGVTMGQLWASVLEAVRDEPLTAHWPCVLTLGVSRQLSGRAFKASLFAGVLQDARDRTEAEITQELALYPTLKGYQLLTEGRAPSWWNDTTQAQPVARLDSLVWTESVRPPDGNPQGEIHARTTDYRGRRVVRPTYAPADTEPLHPLLTWWAILFALSMLCRYRPVVWSELIRVDTSEYASAIEHLLDVGLDAVPDLIERTIRWVAV